MAGNQRADSAERRKAVITKVLRITFVASALALSGCASFSADRGLAGVQTLAGPLGNDIVAIRSDDDAAAARSIVQDLLASRLSADDAVRIAMLNNRDVQAAFNRLGIAEAERVSASLPDNPGFSFERIAGAGSVEIEARVVMSVISLLTLPARAEIAEKRFRQAQLEAAETVLRIATETRRAYYRALASKVAVNYLAQSQAAAKATSELSAQLGETGTMTKLDQALDQVFFAELSAQLAEARQVASSSRERLVRAMGVWGDDIQFKLPVNLPALPDKPDSGEEIERDAVAGRLDLQIARLEANALAQSTDLTNATRMVTMLDLAGIKTRTTSDEAIEKGRGIGLDLELPVFDLGAVKVHRAEETYMEALNRLTAKAINVRSEAREAYASYRSAYDLARHYQREVLPLRKIITDETLLRYNAMQIDVFTLLIEARQRIASSLSAIEKQEAFWLAATDLGAAVLGGGGLESADRGSSEDSAAASENSGH